MRLDKPFSRTIKKKNFVKKQTNPWRIIEDEEGNPVIHNKETGVSIALVPKQVMEDLENVEDSSEEDGSN